MNTITDLINAIRSGAFNKVMVCNMDIPFYDSDIVNSERGLDSIETAQQAVKNGLKLIDTYKEISKEIARAGAYIQDFPIKMIDNSKRPITRISLDFTREAFEVVVPFVGFGGNKPKIKEVEEYLKRYKEILKEYKEKAKRSRIKSKKLNKLLNKIREDSKEA